MDFVSTVTEPKAKGGEMINNHTLSLFTNNKTASRHAIKYHALDLKHKKNNLKKVINYNELYADLTYLSNTHAWTQAHCNYCIRKQRSCSEFSYNNCLHYSEVVVHHDTSFTVVVDDDDNMSVAQNFDEVFESLYNSRNIDLSNTDFHNACVSLIVCYDNGLPDTDNIYLGVSAWFRESRCKINNCSSSGSRWIDDGLMMD